MDTFWTPVGLCVHGSLSAGWDPHISDPSPWKDEPPLPCRWHSLAVHTSSNLRGHSVLSCPFLTCQMQQLWFCGALRVFSPSKGAWESMRNPPGQATRPFWIHGQPPGGPTPPNIPSPPKTEVFTGVGKTLWKSRYSEIRKGAGCNS